MLRLLASTADREATRLEIAQVKLNVISVETKDIRLEIALHRLLKEVEEVEPEAEEGAVDVVDIDNRKFAWKNKIEQFGT